MLSMVLVYEDEKQFDCCYKSMHVITSSAQVIGALLVFTCTDIGLLNLGIFIKIIRANGLKLRVMGPSTSIN